MASSQLKITSVNFSKLSKSVLSELWNDTNFHDVTLVCDGDVQIKAHKVVLAAFSQFFKNIFIKNPHQHPLIYIKGVNLVDLKAILDFIHCGEVTVRKVTLDTLLQLSKNLEVSGLFEDESFKENITGENVKVEKIVITMKLKILHLNLLSMKWKRPSLKKKYVINATNVNMQQQILEYYIDTRKKYIRCHSRMFPLKRIPRLTLVIICHVMRLQSLL